MALVQLLRQVPRNQTSRTALRTFSSGSALKEKLNSQVKPKQAAFKELKAKHGKKIIDQVTVDQCLGGARSVKCMVWETSLLDSLEGIRFRGYTIPELQKLLPAYEGGEEPMPEALFWLLLTSEVPTKVEVDNLTAELHSRSRLPDFVEPLIRSLPKTMHPMTQLSMAVLALQHDSVFAKKYAEGTSKALYWEHTYEDMMNLTARMPEIAALIYRCTYFDGKMTPYNSSLDYSANFNRMLGYDDKGFDELMRLYLTIHSDHEGGNASAHTTHLVGSTLSDAYLAFSGGLNALAGPLHGLANQEVLSWILDLKKTFDARSLPVNKETITEFAWETLNAGKVIPGYGHAVLRKTDPRYTCQREFALKHMPDDELFHIVNTIYEVMPGVLTEHGKTKNPFPNVDSHSGVLLQHYGFTQFDYYTVLFGVGRSLGVLAQLFWDRALGLPLERPKSVTPEWIEDYCNKMDEK